MGRGEYSKMVRKTNRATERGTKLGGTQHTCIKGRKWSRKDVLETRKRAKLEVSVGTAFQVEKTLKSRNKGTTKELAQKMEALLSNTE